MPLFDNLQLWMDPVRRDGPEAMAVDEWLLEGPLPVPVLRIYRWRGEWGSLGYFGNLGDAQASFPELQWVRRWTGGGTVDHRQDWTYTLVVPVTCPVARMKGAESYRAIHSEIAATLQAQGISASLSAGEAENGSAVCFDNPVCHDLIDSSRHKIAGAGQRRTRRGLLHQGSVAISLGEKESHQFGFELASRLTSHPEQVSRDVPEGELEAFLCRRYASAVWLCRR